MMKTVYLYSVLLLFLLNIYSCREDNATNPIDPKGQGVVVELNQTNEVRIHTVDVFAFRVDANDNSKEYFTYYAQGMDISDGETLNKKKFVLPLLKGGSDKYRFVILANCRNEIEDLGDINTSALKTEVLKRLIKTSSGKWETDINSPDYKAIPMWCESAQLFVDDNTTTIEGLYLVKMLARIDLAVTDSIRSIFKLKSVRVYNYNTSGKIIPFEGSEFWNDSIALKPSLPTPNGKTLGPLEYNQLSTPNISTKGQIYLYESLAALSDKPEDATCIVVGGEYNNEGKETFYRIDFGNRDTNNNMTYLDILRNHLYNVNISQVLGSGYETPQEAFNSQQVNINANVTVWAQAGMSDIIFDGKYTFKINQSHFVLPMNERSEIDEDNKIKLFTDYPNGWSIEKIVDINGDSDPANWLTLSQYSGVAGSETSVSILAGHNFTGTSRTAYIYIETWRFQYVVEVVQTNSPEIGLKITDANGNPINDMKFIGYVGSVMPIKNFNVNWLPRKADLSVSLSTYDTYPMFDFGTGDVIRSETISGGNGLKSYMIQPPPFNASDITSNPFFQRVSKVSYSVNNGVKIETKTIFLQQINNNANPIIENYYWMDGGLKSLKVQANAPWTIEVTNDPNNVIQNLLTTEGGFSKGISEEFVYFNIINDMTNLSIVQSDVTLTIKSVDPNYPFPDVPVTLNCISAIPKKRLLTIGGSPNGWGYNFSGTAASNKLITTTTNFGVSRSSVVKSQGFNIIDGGTNPSEAQLKGWLIDNPVDIVILGYDNSNISIAIASLYSQFLNKGGVLLAFQDRTDATVSSNLLKTILGNGVSTAYATGAGSIYQFVNIDDPVLMGPFGNIKGLQWGEDASTTVRVTGYSTETVQVLTGDRDISTATSVDNPAYATAIKHKTLNFIWAGDGGFNANDTGTSQANCPFKLDANYYPVEKKIYGRGTRKYPVYNAVFTANAIAWALNQSQLNQMRSSKVRYVVK